MSRFDPLFIPCVVMMIGLFSYLLRKWEETMRKIYSLRKMALETGGEYVLGARDLRTHACYLIYGELAPGERGRKVCPGAGHEEILLAVKGNLSLSAENEEIRLQEGEALHFQEEETVFLANPGQEKSVYIPAGGHSGRAH